MKIAKVKKKGWMAVQGPKHAECEANFQSWSLSSVVIVNSSINYDVIVQIKLVHLRLLCDCLPTGPAELLDPFEGAQAAAGEEEQGADCSHPGGGRDWN